MSIEEQQREVQKAVLLVQHTGKNTFFIGIDGVADLQACAGLAAALPRVEIQTCQLLTLSVALRFEFLNVAHEVANLIESVPNGELNFRPCRRFGHGHGDADQVRRGLAQIENVGEGRTRREKATLCQGQAQGARPHPGHA